MPTIATHTLGCKLNFAETSHLVRQFVDAGYLVADFHDVADIYVVNTCTVTAMAEKKCRMVIRQAVAQNPAAIVAVIGCFAQNAAADIARIPGVSLILGNDLKHTLFSEVQRLLAEPAPALANPTNPLFSQQRTPDGTLAFSSGDRTRTFFKIQDGCDYFCTYCAIPFARGRSRSASIADTVDMARHIAESGTKEIVLTGVNTGTFGLHQGEQFIELLKRLDEVEGILRYRISSIEPNLITDQIIDFVAQSRAFLPHFHIPLQAGSDKVLKMMHRHYDTALYASRIQHIKQVMPHACIAADVITGFNGEDDDTFQQSKAFIDSLPISYLHVFPYSDRPGTLALKLPEKIAIPVRKARSQELHELSDHKRKKFIDSQIGQSRSVLWEHTCHQRDTMSLMEGWTDNYIRLQRPYSPTLAGTITIHPIDLSTIVENFSCED